MTITVLADNDTSRGGNGLPSSITGTSIYYAGGGSGGSGAAPNNVGGLGGGGVYRAAGGPNLGGGGGAYGAGGKGVVILKYLTSEGTITIGAGLTGSTETSGSYKVTTITNGTGNVSWA
jgi:hypothetical protein